MSKGTPVINYFAEMLKSMENYGDKPGEFRMGKNAYKALLGCDCFLQGNPPKILGVPVVLDKGIHQDMVYLFSNNELKEISRDIKINHSNKTIRLPKWGFGIKNEKEWWEK